jgi:hypothetical protein
VEQNGTPSFTLLHKDQMLRNEESRNRIWLPYARRTNLLNLDNASLENEIIGSKRDIDQMLAQDTLSFAYPYGSCDEKINRR